MERYQLMLWGLKAIWTLFIFAYGACVGSLINVIVYRVPKGLSIVSPPSRCPSCNTRLTWRENIPVLGWLLLRGKCRFCKTRISAEYPIVEAGVGLLFCLFYVIWYVLPDQGAVFLGIDWSAVKPEWAHNDAAKTWPTFVILLVLLGSLVAMTIIDARTFTIPIVLTWVPAIVAVLAHPVHAAWVGVLRYRATPTTIWAIATPQRYEWMWAGATTGAMVGLGVALLLLRLGLIRRSFADYQEWEEKALKEHAAAAVLAGAAVPVIEPGVVAPSGASEAPGSPVAVLAATEAPVVTLETPVVTLAAAPDAAPSAPADLWIMYPHARREMPKEIIFLAPCVLLAVAGWFLARWMTGMTYNQYLGMWVIPPGGAVMPVWLTVLTGVLMGYLIGGGVVWGVRILGSAAFGKEAMGLGDVHLMAAVGACLGWIDSVLAFFGAAFVGLFWFLLGSVFSGKIKRTMPYGPYLAVSTVLVLLCKPLIEAFLSFLTGQRIDLP